MLNQEKIRIMTKLAAYEQRDGRQDLKINQFYKNDYTRYLMLKTWISVTVGYGLVLSFIGIYNMEYLLNNLVELDYKKYGFAIFGIYVIILLSYELITVADAANRYKKSRKRLGKYYKDLKGLRKIYRSGEMDTM